MLTWDCSRREEYPENPSQLQTSIQSLNETLSRLEPLLRDLNRRSVSDHSLTDRRGRRPLSLHHAARVYSERVSDITPHELTRRAQDGLVPGAFLVNLTWSFGTIEFRDYIDGERARVGR